MLIVDAGSGRILDANRHISLLTGYSHEQLTEKSLWELGRLGDAFTSKCRLQELQDAGASRHDDLPLETADGRLISVEVTSNVYLEGDRRTIQCQIRDISDRRLREESQRVASEVRRLALVMRDSHDAIIVQDLDGAIIAWNPGAARLYGWTEAEALVMNARDRYPVELRDEALARMRHLSVAPELEPHHATVIARDGSIIAVTATATALLDETGRMYAVATTERPVRNGDDRQEADGNG